MDLQSNVLWTRSEEDWEQDEAVLRSHGLAVEHVPCLALRPLLFAKPAQDFDIGVVTSASVARVAAQQPVLLQFLKQLKTIYTFGPKTAAALQDLALPVTLLEAKKGQELADILQKMLLKSVKVVICAAAAPAYDIAGHLQQAGITAEHLSCYETTFPQPFTDAKARELLGKKPLVTFASPSAVHGFCVLFSDVSDLWNQLEVVSIGPTTSAACLNLFAKVHEAPEATMAAMIKTIKERLKK